MRTVSGSFYESKVRIEKMTEEGQQVKFNELYVVNSMSFSECEQKVIEVAVQNTVGEYEVLTEKKAPYREIFFSDNSEEDIFFIAKVAFITIDEVSGKERKQKVTYLVQGSSVESARKNVDEVMGQSMTDYKIVSIGEVAVSEYVE